jgi:hypothetical protein
MQLTSGIAKKYTKPFILDEDSLRRIYSVLEKAARDLSELTTIIFHIEREDDRYYETSEINDVLSDPNIISKRINLVSIELRYANRQEKSFTISNRDWIVMILFSFTDNIIFPRKSNRVSVRIASDNKNWALLLSDELEPQIQRTFKVKQTPRWTLILFILPFIILGGKFWSLLNLSTATSSNIMSSVFSLVLMLFLAVFLILMIGGIPQWYIRAFGPEPVFLWGEELEAYQDREKTRQNILWAIIIAFTISFAASIVFALLFAPQSLSF